MKVFPIELEYMLAIRETGNLTRAAEKLRIAQPSLSQKIRRMEAELGCPLLLRLPSGVRLTRAGESYCRMATRMLALYNGFLDEIGQMKALSAGSLHIGANWYITTTFLPEPIRCFKDRWPDMILDLTEARTGTLMEQLANGKLDAAFVSRYPSEEDPGGHLFYRQLYRDHFCVAAAEKTDLSAYANARDPGQLFLNRLDGQPFILFRENQRIRQITDQAMAAAQISPRVSLTTYGFPIAVEAAAAGHGLLILPRRYAELVRERYPIRIYTLEEKYNAFWDIGICCWRSAMATPGISALLRILDELDIFTAEPENGDRED